MVTGFVAASSTSAPPTVTVKASAAGTEPGSRSPSKVTVSASPTTAADENAGGVLLVTDRRMNSPTAFSDRSRNGVWPDVWPKFR